ncbi:NfeD family protein [Paenibacillus koleovorans]|uniref:NfeD family protein n=1 Tax=Paenibacillus koleovorans TaxID=121608 RepID=UPI000FDC78B1|nr:nodulation protein NfeD [Paenibacillus koleovorans]
MQAWFVKRGAGRGLIAMIKLIAALLLLTVSLAGAIPALAADKTPGTSGGRLVYIVPVQQTIESGLESFLKRAFADAEEANARLIVLDIDTLGGRLDAAENIGKLIRQSKVETIAFVQGRAVSAGSYIALNATKIVMQPGSSIGSAAVVDGNGDHVKDSKIVSHWSSEMRAAAELRGRNPAIAEGMVDENLEVVMTKIKRTVGKGELVSLTAEEALAVGYADKVASTVDEVIAFAGVKDPILLQFEPTFYEKLARFLVHPVVMTLLLLIGIAGVAIELFVPGFGVPGILGIAGFGLYFFGHYIAGFAGGEDVTLFVIGIVLLIIEIFLPTFGILGILGIISIITGVVMAAFDSGNALLSLGIAVVLSIIVIAVFIRVFKHRGIWNKFILKEQLTSEEGFISQASKEHLVGHEGVTVTPLRPAGTAEINGERIDVVTDGEFIPVQTRVRVEKVEGTRVVVRTLE